MFLFPFELWILRGIVLTQLLIILILIVVIIVQCKKMKGLLLIDLSKKRAAKKELKNIESKSVPVYPIGKTDSTCSVDCTEVLRFLRTLDHSTL